MLRSMFSAVSGLRSHQTMMDVTGNNVSNVNTAGYKAARTTFSETLTQVVRGGSGAIAADGAAVQGGINPMQLGLGARVGATDLVFSQGASQATGRATDLAIQGDGFFVVSAGNEQFYTRAGAFSLDASGNLVGGNGELVQGWMSTAPDADGTTVPAATEPLQNLNVAFPDVDGNPTYTDIAVGGDGAVTGRNAAGELHVLGKIAMARFQNTNGLQRVGSGLYSASPNSGDALVGAAGTGGLGTLQAGTLEMSNVDMAQEFTNLILAQRGFQANARTISASDELLQDLVNLKR